MALSLKQFLLLILFICFAFSALLNSQRPFMLETVKLITFATLVAMAYGVWTNTGETRAYCAGFLLWGGLYYILFVVMQSKRWDFGVEILMLWLGQFLDRMAPGQIIWAVYEKTAQLLLSILFGIIGGWVTVYYYRKRQKSLSQRNRRQST